MRHITPPPLKVAMDLVKRFNMELGPKMTPEQRRDFARLQKLLEDADRGQRTQTAFDTQRAALATPHGRGY